MRITSVLAATACVAALAGATSSAALAGEITGNGKPLWTNTDQWGVPHTLHANSICAFSGQEDNQFPGTPSNPNLEFSPDAPHSQSWGQDVSAGFVEPSVLKGGDPSPGPSCNGHTGYLSGGGGG
jgi:hypothetical protein